MSKVENPYAPPVEVETPHLSAGPGGGQNQWGLFRDASGVARTTIVFLSLACAGEGLGLLANSLRRWFSAEIVGLYENDGTPTLAAGAIGVLIMLQLMLLVVASIGATISFCIWFYRVYGNLRALDEPLLRHAQGMAPGGFFIPIVNLYLPYQIGAEIWAGSRPRDSSRWRASPVGIWWGLYLSGNTLGVVALNFSGSTLDISVVAYVLELISSLLTGAGAILAIQMIRGIQWRQAKKYAELQAARVPLVSKI